MPVQDTEHSDTQAQPVPLSSKALIACLDRHIAETRSKFPFLNYVPEGPEYEDDEQGVSGESQ